MLDADVVVIGDGIAGSAAALAAARKGAGVVILTKLLNPEEANIRYAQGGIVYTSPDDSPGLLVEDILGAGSGSRAAAEVLSLEGPPLVRGLLIEDLEVPFDRDRYGFEGLHLTLEGAHWVPRILHHRDTTGQEIQHAFAKEEESGSTALGRALVVARTVLEGALADRRSRGCHYRLDAEEEVAFADLPG